MTLNGGGSRYISILTSILGLLIVARSDLKPKQLIAAVSIMCIFSMLPFIATTVFVLSGGQVWQHFYIFKPLAGVGNTLHAMEAGELTRFQSGSSAIMPLLLAACGLYPFYKSRKPVALLIITIALIIAGLTGYRILILQIIAFHRYLCLDCISQKTY